MGVDGIQMLLGEHAEGRFCDLARQSLVSRQNAGALHAIPLSGRRAAQLASQDEVAQQARSLFGVAGFRAQFARERLKFLTLLYDCLTRSRRSPSSDSATNRAHRA
jgi:hypothetical protein